MLHYFRNYPFSLLILVVIVYLSFFKPSGEEELALFTHFDKVAHFCMYAGLSGMLWLEFLRAHRKGILPMWHVWIGAAVCPVLFSGTVEILQTLLTSYRSGDWADFAANSLGVVAASLIGRFVLMRWIVRR
ncbi:MAG: VanZ family protein [Prevotellaceae bacterium]|jgi:VanZ family protein|nr:VanZ family protein [Prevotellaceae bacterium]